MPVAAGLFVLMSAMGLAMPNTNTQALMRTRHAAGSASALLGTSQFLIGAIASPAGRHRGREDRRADGRGAGGLRPVRDGVLPAAVPAVAATATPPRRATCPDRAAVRLRSRFVPAVRAGAPGCGSGARCAYNSAVNATLPTAEALRAALAALLDGLPPTQAAQAVDRLIASYRGTTPTDAPVLRDRSDVAAYAAYRMPATFEAVRSCLAALREAAPGLGARHPHGRRGRHGRGELGGRRGLGRRRGRRSWTGPSRPSPSAVSWPRPPASPALRARRLAAGEDRHGARAPAPTDLVTVSYVLKELTARGPGRAVVDAAAAAAQAVVIVEPGTPDGYAACHRGPRPVDRRRAERRRALPARRRLPDRARHGLVPLLGAGQPLVAAPPGQGRLAQPRGREVQLRRRDRAFRHRRRPSRPGHPQAADPQGPGAAGAVHPGGRACGRATVTKRHGALYRAARDTAWGDAWPPPDRDGLSRP